ncbi:MAG: tetratricopeptide repeat protein [Thermomicrobiales bacterium]
MNYSSEKIDRFGLPITTTSQKAVDLYVEGLDRILSGNTGAEASLRAAIDEDEGFAMAYAALSGLDMRQRRFQDARSNAERARELTSGLTRRERSHVETTTEMILGRMPNTMKLTEEHLQEFPGDANILQQYTYLNFGAGDRERNARTLGIIERIEEAYGDEWYYTGTRSFYLHELDRFDESRHYAERSLSGNPRNGNASHNMAHCFYETSDYTGGIEFIAEWIDAYDARAPFFSHLNWHLALFELTQGRYKRAHEIYRQTIRPSVLEQAGGLGPPIADATSLLWRFRLYGYPVSADEWDEVATFSRDSVNAGSYAWQDMHAALALAATGDTTTLDAMTERLRRRAERGNTMDAEVTLPLVRGIEAFARGAYDETVKLIEPIAPEMVRLGGSRAQRQVFEETLLQAYLNAEQYEKAEGMLRKRLEHRHSARDFFWLAEAQQASGDLAGVAASLRTVREDWSGADADGPELAALKS